MPSALLRAAWAAIATAGAASAATMTVSCDLLPPVVTLTLLSPQASPAATCPQFNPALGSLTNVIYVEEFALDRSRPTRVANLGGMIGTGSFHVPITLSSSGFSRTPQGLLLESYSMTLVQSGSSYLSYIYDPVPEPASWMGGLCAIGLIVLVNRQRHRRRALT
jgi:hypothetical protein